MRDGTFDTVLVSGGAYRRTPEIDDDVEVDVHVTNLGTWVSDDAGLDRPMV